MPFLPPHTILYFLLPLQVGSDLSEKPSPESTGVWLRRTLSHWAPLARRQGEGAQLLSCRCSSASPVHVLLPSSWPASTRSLCTHVRSLLINRARKETHRRMGTPGPRPCPWIRKRKVQKLEL